jgi:hypothetical protein
MNETKSKKMKGGEVTQEDFDNYVKTHDIRTYKPKTPPEKQLYNKMVKYQLKAWKPPSFRAGAGYAPYMSNYKKSYNETIQKFANNVDSVTQSDYINQVSVNAVDVIDNPDDRPFEIDPSVLGHNDAILNVMMQQWEDERIKSYNDAIKEYGGDPEKLWDTDYKKHEPNPNQVLRDEVGPDKNKDGIDLRRRLIPVIDSKYYWNPQIVGFNESIGYMKSVIPRPSKKNWADYFVQGLTMPFTLASKIPGLNMIPGVKLTADILGGLHGGQLPVIKGHYLI